MEISAEQLKKIQSLELDMLRMFIQVCEQLDLKYFVLGGTLLGAVRHQGFIPWDDDIDVGMPRQDYEKFLARGQEYLPEGFFLQTFVTDPEYPANFAKIRNCNTTFVEASVKNCKMNHGLYIDVFPLDYYSDGRMFRMKNMLMKLRITDAFTLDGMKGKTKAVRCLSRILYPSIPIALAKREALFKSVTNGARITNYCGAWGKKEIVPAQWCGESIELLFDGVKVQAPKEYDKWLTQLYGDYMQLPPEEQRVAHHYVEVVDLERSYTEYKK